MDRNFDKQYLDNNIKIIVGVDEAGRDAKKPIN